MKTLADAHLHLFRHGFPGGNGQPVLGEVSDIDAYERLRRNHPIAKGLVIGYEADGIDPDNNAYLRSLAATRPWIASLAFLPVASAPSVEAIDWLFGAGHVGVALYLPDAAAAKTLCAWPASVWAAFNRHKAILSLNARPEATVHLERLVETLAGCPMLFSHLGLPGLFATRPSTAEAEHRIDGLLRLAKSPNVRVKISGLYATSDAPATPPHPGAQPFIDIILDRFGPERCLWGSDFSPALEWVDFEDTFAATCLGLLTATERDAVMGLNLLKLLHSPT
ncbi:amidohydrolase family protein [Mesorhizobium sp. A556]